MSRQQFRTLDLATLKSTYPDGDPYDLTIAGDFCIISTGEPLHLAFAASKLSAEGGWELHGSPAHDGNRFHQWMVRKKNAR